MKPKHNLRPFLAATCVCLFTISSASAQINWSGTSSGAWLTTTNWTGGDPAGDPISTTNTDIAVFNVNANNTVGINMNDTSGNYYLGAIDNTNATARSIQNSSTTVGGILTLNGATVNSIANTVLRNSTNTLLTIRNGTGSGTMGLKFNNATSNVVQITGTGGITISSKISGSNGFTKAGSGTGALTLQGDNTGLSGTIDLQAGRLSAGGATANVALGTEFGTGEIDVTSGAYIRFFQVSNTSATAYANNLTLRGNGNVNGALQNDGNASGNHIFWGGTITLAADATINAQNSGRYTFNGNIGQSGGSRTLSLNLNGGPHAINAGLTMNAVTHTGAGEINFGSGATIDIAGTWSSAAGGGALNFGTSTVNALGTLTTERNTNLGKVNQLTASTIVNVNGGTFDIGGFNQTIGSLASGLTAGNVNLGAGTLTTGGNDATTSFGGAISGIGGGLTKNGTGTMTLNGTNTYTGATTLNRGTLTVGATATLSGSTASLAVNNTNTGAGNNVVLNLTTGANTTVGSLSGTIATPSGGINTATINTQSTRTFTVNQTANASYAGTIAGDGGFTLGSSSTHSLTLSGTNSYTGPTNVNAGTLIINGSTSSTSLVNVAPGATLGGSGTIGGNTTISGTHNPGNSPGIQTFSGNLSYVDGGIPDPTVNWELTGNTTTNLPNPNAIFDQIIVGGNLNFTDLTTINLIFNGSGSTVLWTDTFWDTDQSWLVYDVAGTTTNLTNLSLNSINWADSGGNLFSTTGGSFALTPSGQDVILSYTIIPEPKAALLGSIGLLLLLRRRR